MHESSRSSRLAGVLLLGAAAALAGCASSGGRKAQLELAQFVTQLSGVYDNKAQVATHPELGEVEVSIQPAYAPALGKLVFYMHETAAGDARRIISQRLVALELDDNGKIAQRDWVFVDTPRWRSAREQPDLFKSLIAEDVRPTAARKLAMDGDELTLQVTAGQGATALRLRRHAN